MELCTRAVVTGKQGGCPMAKESTKFIKPLREEQKEELWDIASSGSTSRLRHRAHAVLLSDAKKSAEEIAEVF